MNIKNNVGNKSLSEASIQKTRFVRYKLGKGFSLIELSIVIVIVSILLAVGLGITRSILSDNRANDELKELPLIVTRLQKLYNNRATSAGVTTAIAISNNIFPAERVISPTEVTNRWGGTVTVAPATIGTANDAIAMTYNAVKTAECLAVISQIEASMRTISVAGVLVKNDGEQPNLGLLGTQCSSASEVVIVYTFSK